MAGGLIAPQRQAHARNARERKKTKTAASLWEGICAKAFCEGFHGGHEMNVMMNVMMNIIIDVMMNIMMDVIISLMNK